MNPSEEWPGGKECKLDNTILLSEWFQTKRRKNTCPATSACLSPWFRYPAFFSLLWTFQPVERVFQPKLTAHSASCVPFTVHRVHRLRKFSDKKLHKVSTVRATARAAVRITSTARSAAPSCQTDRRGPRDAKLWCQDQTK